MAAREPGPGAAVTAVRGNPTSDRRRAVSSIDASRENDSAHHVVQRGARDRQGVSGSGQRFRTWNQIRASLLMELFPATAAHTITDAPVTIPDRPQP